MIINLFVAFAGAHFMLEGMSKRKKAEIEVHFRWKTDISDITNLYKIILLTRGY